MNHNALNTEDFSIVYDEASQTLRFIGRVRLLKSRQVNALKECLQTTMDHQTSLIHWDFQHLQYMDSTALHLLYSTLMRCRGKEHMVLKITGDDHCRVQQKLIPNIKRLFPKAELQFVAAA